MAIKDKSQLPPLSHKQLPPFSPEDEKKARQELARLRRKKKRGFEGKTLWDWLQLLGVPIFLAFATIGFGFVQFYLAGQQHQHDQDLADQQHASDQRIANQQHTTDQQNALDQQHATTLQTYIDNIQELLLKDNLRGSKPSDAVAILARARTLTALQGLDPDRKGRLVQFLYEAQLIGFQDDKLKLHDQIIDLSGANLSGTNLSGTNFVEALFNRVNPSFATLTGADLSHTNLSRADLTLAHLSHANLSVADLTGADLNHANLSVADLSRADLSRADLTGADLSRANLSGADLRDADLSFADLRDADLSVATHLFSGADLTQQQLDQVLSCEGATLPQELTCNKTP